MKKIFQASLDGGLEVLASLTPEERVEAAAVIRKRAATLAVYQAGSVTGMADEVQAFNYARLNQVVFSNTTTTSPECVFASWSSSDAPNSKEDKED